MPSASLRHRRRRRHTNRKSNRSSSRSNNRRTPVRKALSAKKRKVRRSTMQRRRAAARIERFVRRTDVRKRQHHKRGNPVVRKSCCGGQPSNFVVTAQVFPKDEKVFYEFEAKKNGPGFVTKHKFNARIFKLYDTPISDIKYLEYFELPAQHHRERDLTHGLLRGMFNFTKTDITPKDNRKEVLIRDYNTESNRTYTIQFEEPAALTQFMEKVKNGVKESTAIPQNPHRNPTATPVPTAAPLPVQASAPPAPTPTSPDLSLLDHLPSPELHPVIYSE